MISTKNIKYEFPEPDNTEGEMHRYICDATHMPSGMRARGRGGTAHVAKINATENLMTALEKRDGHSP